MGTPFIFEASYPDSGTKQHCCTCRTCGHMTIPLIPMLLIEVLPVQRRQITWSPRGKPLCSGWRAKPWEKMRLLIGRWRVRKMASHRGNVTAIREVTSLRHPTSYFVLYTRKYTVIRAEREKEKERCCAVNLWPLDVPLHLQDCPPAYIIIIAHECMSGRPDIDRLNK